MAVICVAESRVNDAPAPPSETEITSSKPEPVIDTVLPVGPLTLEKPVMMGDDTLATSSLTSVLPPVVTLQCP